MRFNDKVFNYFPELKTKRLILRRIRKSDANEMFEIYSNEAVMKHFGRNPYKSLHEAEENIKRIKTAFKKGEGIRWAITLKGNDKLIGSAGIWRLMKEHFRGEVGYELSPEYWKKGIMFEALSGIINFGFKKMNLHTIEANLDPKNIASVKLLEKSGFKKEGHTKESFFFNNRFEDTGIYSLIRSKK